MEEMLRRLIGEDIQLDTLAGKGLGSVEADPSQLEQVVMSGYTDEAGHHGLIDPDVLFLQKPFTAEQLPWKIRDAVSTGAGRAA